jgi:hypothetical protein
MARRSRLSILALVCTLIGVLSIGPTPSALSQTPLLVCTGTIFIDQTISGGGTVTGEFEFGYEPYIVAYDFNQASNSSYASYTFDQQIPPFYTDVNVTVRNDDVQAGYEGYLILDWRQHGADSC